MQERDPATHDPATLALAALKRCRPAQFQVVAWHLEHPTQTQSEIGQALGVSQQNVSKLLRRGLKNLETLKARIITLSAGKRNNS